MSSLSMVFDVLAIDRATEVFHRIGNAAGDAGKKVEESTTNVNNAGSKLAAGVGIAAAAVAVASVKMAGDFQASTTRLVTSANETQGNLDMVRKGLLDMAGQVGYSVEELSKAMYKVESGGQHGADGLMVLKAAAQGAKTENADLTTVADAVTSAMQDYHLKATDAADVTSKLVAATASGKMTFQELAGSMAAILPTASANHIALNDILGDLASMTVHGMSAEQASQNMADAIRHLAGSSQMSTHELALLGFTAQQVSRDLSTKGLSGTVQELSEAVLKNMGPGTSEVVLQLGAALNGLSPAVRDLGMKLMDGTISQADYVKAAKQLAPELQGQAAQFATLAKATHGIGNEQMSGSQVMLSYSGAMKALMGDATGMNVALMLTGENTKTTTTAIENITKATADAHHNVQGWDLIQGNFNQKLDETKGHLQAMAIEAGTKMLPALTSAMDFINSKALPGIEHLGSAVASAAKWFGELPGPVKAAAEAIAALKFAEIIGLTGKLTAGLAGVRSGLSGFAKGMSTGAGALNMAKSAGAGLVSMLGGPVVLGIGALTAAFVSSRDQINGWAEALGQGGRAAATATDEMRQAHKFQLQNASSLTEAWALAKGAFTDGLSQIKGYSSALDEATKKAQANYDGMSAHEKISYNVTAATNNLKDALAQYGSKSNEVKWATFEYNQALGDQKTAEQSLEAATRGANGTLSTRISLEQQLAQGSVSLDQATLTSQQAIDDYQKSLKDSNRTEDDRRQALNNVSQSIFGVLDAAKKKADFETTGLPTQIKTNQEIVRQRDALKEVIDKLGFVPPALQGMYDSLNGPTATALEATKTKLSDVGTSMTLVATNDAPGMMKALGDLAKAAGSTFPQAVTGGFLPAAKGASDAITQTGGLADANGKKVSTYGQIIAGLPLSHNTDITADATQANATIDQFMKDVQAKGFVGAVFNVGSPVGSGAQSGGLIGIPPLGSHATGGWTGPGSKYTPAGIVHADEFVFTKEQTNKAGVQNLYAMAAALNGYSGGGLVQQMSYPFDFSQSMKSGAADYIKSLTPQYQVGAGAEQWRGLVDQVLAMLGLPIRYDNGVLHMIQMESGGDPNAINLTDSNAMAGHPSQGLMQTIPSTFAAYAGPFASRSITDPLASIYAGTNYALQTYGPDMIAAGGRQGSGGGYIGYDNGGLLQPGITMAYNGTGKPETIRTAEQEAALHKSGGQFTGTLVLDSGEFLGVVHGAIDSADHALANDVHYGRG